MRLPPLRSGIGLLVLLAALAAPLPAMSQSPSGSAEGGLDAALLSVELMNEAPEAIRASCMPSSATIEGAIASAQCLHEGGLVLYVRFADLAGLQAAYDQVAAMTSLAPDAGSTCGEGAFEGEYPGRDGSVRGRLVCQGAFEAL